MTTEHPSKEQKSADLYWKVQDAVNDLETAQSKFLNHAGWSYSSQHPDCRWRWSKLIEGVNYSLGPDAAIQMECAISNCDEVSDSD